MTSKQKIVLVSVLVAVAIVLVAVGGYFIAVYSSSSGQRTSGGFTYDVDGKTVTILSYTGSDTTVTVPAKIGGKRVSRISKGAFSSSKVTNLIFDDEISQITLDEECFKGVTTLIYVQLPSALKEIPKSAFEDCTSLEHIVIPDGVTTIGESAFEDCTALTYTGNDSNNKQVTLPSSLTSLGIEAFKNCSKISYLNVNSNLKTISQSAFEGCTTLATINFGSDSSVSRIADKAFYKTRVYRNDTSGDYKDKITFPDTLTEIGGYAFAENKGSSLKTVEIPASVKKIGDYAFSSCTTLRTVTFGEESKLEELGVGAFQKCSDLTTIVLPDTITKIPTLAFNGCSDLVTFEIGANVTSIGEGAFGGIANTSSSAIKFTVAEGNDNFVVVRLDDYYKVGESTTETKQHYLLMSADKSKLYAYIGQFNSENCINNSADKNSKSFNFLIYGDEINGKIKTIDAYAFYGLRAERLCIPESVTYVGNYFISDSNVKAVYFGENDCTFQDYTKVFDGVNGQLSVLCLSTNAGTIKDQIDKLNDEGNNDVRYENGNNWPA